MEFKTLLLGDLAKYNSEKILVNETNEKYYISTDNMIADKKGVSGVSKLPEKGKVNYYIKEDILISNIRPYFKKIWFSESEGGHSSDVLNFRTYNNNIIPKYLYYCLFQDEFFNYMMSTAKGTKMPRGDKSAIMKFPIFVPEIREQRKIVKLLSNLDEKINVNNEMINNLEEISQTLFKRWFIDFEFPNEEGQSYKSSGGEMVESELGEIPKGWESSRLSHLAEIIMGQSPKSDTYNNNNVGLPLINGAADIKNNVISANKYTTAPKKIGVTGDYVFGVRATIGLITRLDTEYAIGRGVGIARGKNVIVDEYLFELLNIAFEKFKITASGSVYLNVSRNDLNNYKFILPTDSILVKYHQLLEPFFEQKMSLYKEIQQLEQLRDTLLPKLLSGEIEIPEDLEV
ncbi:restriction endonuclease subunit S [Macrococcus bovicus]|uniref:restriction endonuclease subunit S n=1 Tax=Macrococcus bovicus TaxID=69968 RepID=UPI0025A68596|nr:restriction endonuclease subunit S [Macrococcus bovicus]WJP97394.1 restriction endonuclease subunit S [Macrococcus bovicus]